METAMSSAVYVAICSIHPQESDQQRPDPHHRALWLSPSNGEDLILQIGDDVGGLGYYVGEPLKGKRPQNSIRCEDTVLCGTLPADYYNDAVVLIQSTPVNNTSPMCNCQAWVMEALEALAESKMFVWKEGAEAELQGRRENWQ